jgi:Tfp pilus assembly protein PilN
VIKINLLKNKGKQGAAAEGPTVTRTTFSLGQNSDNGGSGGESSSGSIGALVRLILILAVPAGLAVYEQENLGTLRKELAKINNDINQMNAEQSNLSKVHDVVQQHVADRDRIQADIESLKLLSKIRLRETRALDEFQNIMPRQVWLGAIRVQKLKFEIVGYSTKSEDISMFLKSMEESSKFNEVLLSSTTEEPNVMGMNIKRFEVSGSLETL